MTGARSSTFAFVAALILAASSCSTDRNGDGEERANERTSSTTSESRPGDDVSTSTPVADAFAAQTTEAPPPAVPFEIVVSGAVSGEGRATVEARCLVGSGFLDLDLVAQPPVDIGAYGVTSLVLSAPGYRGPGTYDASAARGEEWSVGLVEKETEEPSEFYSPSSGARGSITVDDGARAGSFDVRGLVDDEERTVAVRGRFTCSVVEG